MVARTLFLIAVTAAVIISFVWLVPLDVVLNARGYSPEQIATVKQMRSPQAAAIGVAGSVNEAQTPQAGQPQSSPQAPAQTKSSENTASEKQAQTNAPVAATAEPNTDDNAAKTKAAPTRQFVATDTINVRAGQGTDTDVVGQFGPRTVVTVLQDPDGDWMKVEANNVSGWVYKPLFEPKR